MELWTLIDIGIVIPFIFRLIQALGLVIKI